MTPFTLDFSLSQVRKYAVAYAVAGTVALFPLPAIAFQTAATTATNAIKDAAFLAVPEAYLGAQRGFDATKLAELTDPNFVEISPVGEVDLRPKMLSFYTADKKTAAPPMRFERVYAHKNGTSGIIVGKVIYTIAAPGGETRTSELTATFHLTRTKGKWKLLSAQYTPVRAAKPPAPIQK